MGLRKAWELGPRGRRREPWACEQRNEAWGQGGEGRVDMRGHETSGFGFYLEKSGAKEEKGLIWDCDMFLLLWIHYRERKWSWGDQGGEQGQVGG